jgi:uncharacterized protein DUF3309
MALSTVFLIILILALLGALPSWPYSRGWGYGPSGLVGLVLVVVLPHGFDGTHAGLMGAGVACRTAQSCADAREAQRSS